MTTATQRLTQTRSESPPGYTPATQTWAVIDHDDRIVTLGEFSVENDANVWFSRMHVGRTCVPLVLLPGQEPRIGQLVRVDEMWSGHLVEIDAPRPLSITLLDAPAVDGDPVVRVAIAGLHAVLDAAALCRDPWRRHELLEQASRELASLTAAHADRVTVAALEQDLVAPTRRRRR